MPLSPDAATALNRRLQTHHLVHTDFDAQFREDVQRGLKSHPKFLLPKYFYDALGSQLFEAICLLPEYYLTRAEDEILERYADEIAGTARAVDGGSGKMQLLEMGSGSSQKTRRLIEALLKRNQGLHYIPIDISPSALETSARLLLEAYPEVSITAYASDYASALSYLADQKTNGEDDVHTLALFLGSNIGNFNSEEANEFLRALRRMLKAGDALLLGADLQKDRRVLEAAYDDALGVTAAFNRNQLVRINRELEADFNVRCFKHIVIYNEAQHQIEVYLESAVGQSVQLNKLDTAIRFRAGERIHTEISRKYDLANLAELATTTGWTLERTWLDRHEQFSSNLFVAVA